jgi:MoaA/NifB/PqqE/SkfB family radical SAM enzyme
MSRRPTDKPAAAVPAELEWELVRRRLDALLEKGLARLDAAPPEPLRELHLELTHRCNLKCVMCEHWEIEHLDPGSVAREMDFADIKRIVEESARLKSIETVVITGGEPWLRHDFVDTVSWLSSRFPDALIIPLTNFWNTGHIRLKLAEFRARGVRNLRLGSSLDGLGATHDKIRGQDGAFSGLVRTVKAVRAEFPEYPFGFTLTILPENAGEVHETWRFVRDELGSSLGCQWVVETQGIEPVRWTAEAKARALDGLMSITLDLAREYEALRLVRDGHTPDDRRKFAELLYWHYLGEYGRDPRRFPFFTRCTAGERHLMLDPEGEAFFCPVNRAKTIGNARRDGVDALWESKKAEELREFVAARKCHCWLRCVAAPAIDRLLRLADA